MGEVHAASVSIPEAARALGVTRNALWRQVRAGRIPSLTLQRRCVRIEAQSVWPEAPPLVPVAAKVTGRSLALYWGVDPKTVLHLVRTGDLPATRNGRLTVIKRAEIASFVTHNSSGVLGAGLVTRMARAQLNAWMHDEDRARTLELRALIRQQLLLIGAGEAPPCACCEWTPDAPSPMRALGQLFRCFQCGLWLCAMCARTHFPGVVR